MVKEIERIIIVTESDDKSSEKVIDWLNHYETSYLRNNVDSGFQKFSILLSNEKTSTSFSDTFFWNRRGYLPIIPFELKKSEWINYLSKEQIPVLFSLEKINQENYLGSYKNEACNNKILNLQVATSVGLEIPKTIVTNNKKDLVNFCESNKRYITKSIFQSPNLKRKNEYLYGNGTIELNLTKTAEVFSPSLVQEYIEKEIEIRIFFIEDNFFSMAIFSQGDQKTKIDFRNYNIDNPNRNVPYNLPKQVLNKLKKFAQLINCNTGSIDLILTPAKKYVFLEINPMGQFDWLSQDCNYYIEKKIAEILLKKNNGKRN
ncbi:MAG: grasp-with-spasm system ATP-grasp peptide maturase [Flavobacterium sp.]|uniref:grasp-with-spasm system ATP-grasp peptide maturase n=1 Tax=Flavobacterium sp. TaxID=239 RepID=UPI0032668F14